MSGTVCCYKGCFKSYSTDKDVVSFFKFPDDPKRRRKWMENCSCPELSTLNDRQLRLKRVCSDHFTPISFISAETRNQLQERAVPLSQKESATAREAAAEQAEKYSGKRRGKHGPGRPPKSSYPTLVAVAIKKEPDTEEETNSSGSEEEDEDDEDYQEKDKAKGKKTPKRKSQGRDQDEEASPPTLKKAIISEGSAAVSTATPKAKGRPPKSKSSAGVVNNVREDKNDRKRISSISGGVGKRMADLSVIDQVVKEIKQDVEKKNLEASRKRVPSGEEEKLPNSKRRKSVLEEDIDLGLSEDEFDEDEEEDEDDDEGPERTNREFEMFLETLRKSIHLPRGWGMGGVIWDPCSKAKAIAVSEVDIMANGQVRLKKAIQIFDDTSVKVTIDGIDMSLNFNVTNISNEEDVADIIQKVADCLVCEGVSNFEPDDMIYLPYAKKRGCNYYSESCPVIINGPHVGSLCNPCASLQDAVINRKARERQLLACRRARPVPLNLNHEFGKNLYGLLQEIMEDAEALKSDSKQDRDAVLSKYSNELSVLNGEIQKPEKVHHMNVSIDEVSASFLDIVNRLGFSTPASQQATKARNKMMKEGSRHSIKENRTKKKDRFSFDSDKSFPKVISTRGKVPNHVQKIETGGSSNSNVSDFSMTDGQEYELIGEVEGNDMVQVVEMSKDNKGDGEGEAIEIIEVDDETMAKIQAQNGGLFFQNSSSNRIQVTTLDPSDPNLGHILKAITPSQEFKVA